MEVKLTKPFKNAAGQMQHSVNMEPLLTIGVFRRACNAPSGNNVERSHYVLQELCGLTETELDGLTMHDFETLVGLIDHGEPDEPEEGEKADPKV